jgi:hypothetical protein
MTEVQKEETKKTIASFVAGLLIGAVLVWAFSGNKTEAPTEVPEDEVTEVENNSETTTEDEVEDTVAAPTLQVGEGAIEVADQPASSRIAIGSATYPVEEGWIGVRDYTDGNLGFILGVVRFSKAQGLVPTEIILQRPTRVGREYAVVVFTEDGDRTFNSAGDVQIDKVFATFKAE